MANGEGGDGVHEEYRCPVCSQGGFSTLRGAAEHCTGQANLMTEALGGQAAQEATEETLGGQAAQEETEETASSVRSADAQVAIAEEIK